VTNVTIGNQVSSIGVGEFYYCYSLLSITIPDNVTSIGSEAFNVCQGLQSVIIGNGVTNIDTYAFINCIRLTNVVIGSGVTSIGNWAFCQCYDLASVTIPNSVTSIGSVAFVSCSALTNVVIGSGVTNLGTSAFAGCPNLHQAYFLGNAPTVNGSTGSADTTVFNGETGTVFYAPNTTGWGSVYGGWPTARWTPKIAGTGYRPGGEAENFQFNISWMPNASVVVEASSDLQSWTPVSTNTLVNGASAFTDSTWANYPRRYYRVHSQ
jgi:hypothetical protein